MKYNHIFPTVDCVGMQCNHIFYTIDCVGVQYKPHYAVFMNTVYFWVSAAVYAFVPFCLLAILNCLIARQIRSSLQTRSAIRNTPLMPGHPHHGPSDHSVQRQVGAAGGWTACLRYGNCSRWGVEDDGMEGEGEGWISDFSSSGPEIKKI